MLHIPLVRTEDLVLTLIDLDTFVHVKKLCIFHVFTPLDLTVGWFKWDCGN